MALKPCRECSKPISLDAYTCPNCGAHAPHQQPKAGPDLKAPLLTFAGIVCAVGVILALSTGPSPSGSATTTPKPSPDAFTPKAWPRVATYRQAESQCPPRHNECRRVAAVNEWGDMCSTWLRMETGHRFLSKTRDNPDALFNARLYELKRGVIIMTGTNAATDEVGFHYHYGCRVDTWNENITGIAPPVRVNQDLEFIEFN